MAVDDLEGGPRGTLGTEDQRKISGFGFILDDFGVLGLLLGVLGGFMVPGRSWEVLYERLYSSWQSRNSRGQGSQRALGDLGDQGSQRALGGGGGGTKGGI